MRIAGVARLLLEKLTMNQCEANSRTTTVQRNITQPRQTRRALLKMVLLSAAAGLLPAIAGLLLTLLLTYAGAVLGGLTAEGAKDKAGAADRLIITTAGNQ